MKNENTNKTAVPNMKLELVPIPVSDIDQALDFYVNKLGFNLDHDIKPTDTNRIIQLTPPGSACSILLSTGLPGISDMASGTHKGLHLVVDDINEVRNALIARGVGCGGVDDMGGVLYVYFQDPDGNSWLLQEIPDSFKD
jgi:catechol 2,3-dioxygenase-like lactoylglutathione lyase family enzyme